MDKKWVFREFDSREAKSLQAALEMQNPVPAQLLVQRNIKTFEEARSFFRTSADLLSDPFLMKGMDRAVERIHQAFLRNEKILVYGDYDVDGTTAVAMVYSYLKKIHSQVQYYIPHRFREGYGVSELGIQWAKNEGVQLMITLDCGIKAIEQVQKANELGIDVIICDHHLPDVELPAAYAILNPKQTDCPYPYKELCGCGVGYKLISAFHQRHPVTEADPNELLDLLATAIAADIVPITGENRVMAVLGLEKANQNPSLPLKVLRDINNLKKPFTINDLVFIIAPRVNAAGRMDDARNALLLFIETDEERARKQAMILDVHNQDRRSHDKNTTEHALQMVEDDVNSESQRSTVVFHPEWHKGVVGIVASRLIEHHYRPTVVLTRSGEDKITGSARSIKGFNLFDGLNQCAPLLENWGGHYFAAGLTLYEKNLEAFKVRFDEVVNEMVPPELFQPVIEVDAELPFVLIDERLMNTLKQFAPHGPGNMTPVFLARRVRDYKSGSTILKEKHMKFSLCQNGKDHKSGIGFNLADKYVALEGSKNQLDILFHLEENEWNGKSRLQLKVLDIRLAENG